MELFERLDGILLMKGRSQSADQLTERENKILERLADGLSDQQIADELFLSLNTVKWYNRQIYNKLGVGTRTQAIARAYELQLIGAASSALETVQTPCPTYQIPADMTRFIGRKHESSTIKSLLYTSRLITLTGPPGTGKTRLSLQVAREVTEFFPDGVFFVSLAPLQESRLVLYTIAQAFDLSERTSNSILKTLESFLQEKELLLILDNFEHVIEAASVLPELLAAAPLLKILVTSREVLRQYGEQQYVVPPLQLPEDKGSISAISEAEAVAFFVEKVRALSPDFELTDENAVVLADICYRLDGLPLALELAAARTKLFSLQTLLSQLSHPLDILTNSFRDLPERQRTLCATVMWSYQLLDQQEQILFARLGVFAGGWTLEAAEKVCAGMTGGLESLLDKSLIYQRRDSGGEVRFGMLEILREFALEQLEASGGAGKIRNAHAGYFHELTEQARHIFSEGYYMPPSLLIQMEVENDNIRTALDWLLRMGNHKTASQMIEGLTEFWWRRGHFSEGMQWAERLLSDSTDLEPVLRAKTLNTLGTMVYELGDYNRSLEVHSEMVDLCRQIEDPFWLAWALVGLGSAAMSLRDERELPLLEEALGLFQSIASDRGVGFTLNSLGASMYYQGRYEEAIRYYREALGFHQRKKGIPIRAFINLGFALLAHGDHQQARVAFEQSLDNGLEGKFGKSFVAEALTGIAALLSAKDHLQEASQLLGAVEAIYHVSKHEQNMAYKHEFNHLISYVRQQLAPAVFEQTWAAGYRMSLGEAVIYGKAALADSTY